VRTASVSQVWQPIYQRSVARWKHYEQALGPLFDHLGGCFGDLNNGNRLTSTIIAPAAACQADIRREAG
jgi:hypothetical protein